MFVLTRPWSIALVCAVALVLPQARAAAAHPPAKKHVPVKHAAASAHAVKHPAATKHVAAAKHTPAKTNSRASVKTASRAENRAQNRAEARRMTKAAAHEREARETRGERRAERESRLTRAELRRGRGRGPVAELKRVDYAPLHPAAHVPSVPMYPDVPKQPVTHETSVVVKLPTPIVPPSSLAFSPDVVAASAAFTPTTAMLAVPSAMPAPLKGSHESLVRQNERNEAEGLERIADDDDLRDRVARHELIALPDTTQVKVNPGMPENRRYARPWTVRFLLDTGKVHAMVFPGSFLRVTSAVRTIAFQQQLGHYNGNAAPAEGDVASPHLAGASIDIAKQGFSPKEMAWMRQYLGTLEAAGKIDVEEEFQQSCFHITVYKTYVGDAVPGGQHLAAR